MGREEQLARTGAQSVPIIPNNCLNKRFYIPRRYYQLDHLREIEHRLNSRGTSSYS